MKKLPNYVICTSNIVIKCTDKGEFLVFMVVSSLLKQTNVSYICKRMSQGITLLKHVSLFFPVHVMIYYSLVYAYMTYC
jgi:hypothetical protein